MRIAVTWLHNPLVILLRLGLLDIGNCLVLLFTFLQYRLW